MHALRETKAILADLIGFPSVSSDGNLELIAYCAERLEGLGAAISISRDDTGTKANIFATLGPDTDGGIVLSGHTDVVPADAAEWTHDPFEAVERDGRIYGRGSCDMKGFIAAALAMAPAYAELNLTRPLHFAFTYDEEIGCFGARRMLERLAETGPRPGVCIIGEPTGMRIIEGHKGCYEYTTRFTGAEGHASEPDLGLNAVHYAARYVCRLLELNDELRARAVKNSPFNPPWSTAQAGVIAGGSARNVIARDCAVEWEIRPATYADADFARERMRDYAENVLLPEMLACHPDAAITLEILGEVDGLEVVDRSEAAAIVAELTGSNERDVVSFGTEAGLYQRVGVSTVVCGPGSIEQAHKPDEFVAIEQLDRCLGMLERLGGKLVG
ncbi:MAG: acetylornithine deacetylase [Flavobacteriaceae bacterium]